MSITAAALASHLDKLLNADSFKDYGPNGLQVEGARPITTIATAATASLAAIEAAARTEAEALFVHHGIFWGRSGPLTGMLGQRVRALIQADMHLIAYHLPLDAHPEHGNNAWLLKALNISPTLTFGQAGGTAIGLAGDSAEPLSITALSTAICMAVGHEVIHCPGGPTEVSRIGVVTGGGQNFLADAAALGCHALITGETSEQTWHEAQELGIHCLAAGHHATENHAIHALGSHLSQTLGIQHLSLDLPNPL